VAVPQVSFAPAVLVFVAVEGPFNIISPRIGTGRIPIYKTELSVFVINLVVV
jgi:hypothetical protein